MRRAAAIVLFLIGAALLGLDLRPSSGDDGVVRMSVSFFGSAVFSGTTPPIAEFAEQAGRFFIPSLAISLLLAAWLGWWTAETLGERLDVRISIWSRLLCAAAWAAALDPWIASYVATRQPLSADRYIDIGDLFRAFGLTACWAGALLVIPSRGSRTQAVPTNGSGRGTLVSLAFAVTVAMLLPEAISWILLGGHPLVNDEFGYLFQAQVLSRGAFAQDVGNLADFFPSVQTHASDGRIFAIVFPGHPALLVPGVRIGFPMLLPRMLAGTSVLLTWLLGRRLGVARPVFGAWLLALSPAFLGIETLNLAHGTSLPCLLVFAWASIETIEGAGERRGRSIALAALAGLAFSVGFAARPVTAIAIGAPILVLLILKRPRRAAVLLAAALASTVPAALLFLEFNRDLTGSPLTSVFGAFKTTDVSLYGSVDAATAASITAYNASRASIWFVGLAPGLLLPAIALALPAVPARRWLLAAMVTSLVAFYVPHPFHGIPWVGPVYWSDALPYLALLGAEGLAVIRAAFGRLAVRTTLSFFACGSLVLLASHFLVARDEIERRQRPYEAVRKAGIERGVVFLRIESLRDWRLYPLAPPEPSSPLVFARDLGSRNDELRSALGNPPAFVCIPWSGEIAKLE